MTTAVLREMRWWDIEPVLELEKDLFPEDAWSRGMFWSDLAHARGPGATRRYVVAEIVDETGSASEGASDSKGGARIVGYGGLAAAGDVGDVQTIAVSREHWGTGLGAMILTELLRAATAFECAEVMLECRVDNVRAQKLYERFGFEAIGFRRGYYQPGNVDALVMRLNTAADSGSAAGSTSVQGTEIND
ncbi:GNAT family N-acetyltransferase [Streptomyces sp. NBC_00258]|uniref:GNAT family N-acetyltransferase n=1 Tax=Streptomyces sp. NBC_00258 TaxID=2903642 RepID=UPI002E2BF652|nr:GNAT family N-acetyltransferase [Streptomyces sp. NBC_00258]